MNMKKSVLVLLCSVALAEPVMGGVSFNVDPSQILEIRADGREDLEGYYISFTQLFPGDDNCAARDFAYMRQSDPLAKEMYATALAALIAGETIRITTTGCDAIGNLIQAIAIKRN